MPFVLDLNPLLVLLFTEKNLQMYLKHTMKPESESQQKEAQIYSEDNSWFFYSVSWLARNRLTRDV